GSHFRNDLRRLRLRAFRKAGECSGDRRRSQESDELDRARRRSTSRVSVERPGIETGDGSSLPPLRRALRRLLEDPRDLAERLRPLEDLRSASRALRTRFDDFRLALDRRDLEAYRFALDDFHRNLARWTRAEEEALLPAIRRAGLSDRDPERELRLQWVQVR